MRMWADFFFFFFLFEILSVFSYSVNLSDWGIVLQACFLMFVSAKESADRCNLHESQS